MAVLMIKRSSIPILQYPLNTHSIHIGRDEASDIHLLGESVSRDHGILTPEDTSYRYVNLGRNGTRLDGKKITDHLLRPGDILEIADWELHFLHDRCEVQTDTLLTGAPARPRPQRHNFVGDSPAIQSIKAQIVHISQSDAPVCILGETGSGKEVAANVIHNSGARASGPFVAVNCGAIPPAMIESELFGHERGSFTSAVRDHRGYFEQAGGGTLFLDEIGELSLDLQTRFLRVLETGTFRRVGAQTQTAADFRIICATHRTLPQEVRNGKFREDLFFRLFVLPLQLPPLRDHLSDIPDLVDHFTRTFGRSDIAWSQEALSKLMGHNWPGNVRELKNTVQRSLVLAQAPQVRDADIHLLQVDSPAAAVKRDNLANQERRGIIRTLEKFRGNNTRAAKALGIARTTLIAKIKKLNITPEDFC